jgi:2-isopropylmalate synthase
MEDHLLRHVSIFDTTLRDGEQAPGYSLSVDQKLAIAETVERLGVNTIEIGFPASSPTDFEAARQICRTLRRATPCAFSRSVKQDVAACAEAMADAVNPLIQIATVGSDIHIKYKREITRQQVIKEAVDAVDHAKMVGFEQISLAIEDATRSDITFLKELIGRGIERGITNVVIPDTVGCSLPDEFYLLIKEIRAFVGEGIRISMHCHNDLGLAVANSLAGIKAGGDEVQTTLCGIGERAGNTSVEELVAVLTSKASQLKCRHDIIQHRLYDACTQLSSFIGLTIPAHKSILGRNAFATEAGMHQQAVLKHRFTYEFMRAEDFGAESKIVIGRHSGRNILRHRLLAMGVKEPDPALIDQLYEAIMNEPEVEKYNTPIRLLERYHSISETQQHGSEKNLSSTDWSMTAEGGTTVCSRVIDYAGNENLDHLAANT